MRRLLLGAAGLLTAVVLVGAVVAWLSHRAIRALEPPLPSAEEVAAALAAVPAAELPVRLAWLNTASQVVPRGAVLEASRDPDPDAPYVMAHPAFVLEWSDGRGLLVDAGMEPADALRFGRVLEWFGAAPLRLREPLAGRLGPALAERAWSIVFSHLHADHTGGTPALCAALGAGQRIRLLQTSLQAEGGNYTTRPGRFALSRSPCLAPERLAEGPLAAPAGLPGVLVIAVAGHTPCSQVVVARLAGAGDGRRVVFSGDVVNAVDGARGDVPKPLLYRLLVVPESEPQLTRLRAWLRSLEALGFEIAPSHDQLQLEALGIPEWRAAAEARPPRVRG